MARDALTELGYDSIYLREPTHGPVGRRIRELMVQGREAISPMQEFQLFLEDRAEDVRLNIQPALERGAIVCIDRYYISSMAYQGALGLDVEFIRIENEKIAPRPHLILYFRLPIEVGIQRIVASRADGPNLFELKHYQQKVLEVFESMHMPGMQVCDATLPVGELHHEVMERIQDLLRSRS